jgi:hypothetical protein
MLTPSKLVILFLGPIPGMGVIAELVVLTNCMRGRGWSAVDSLAAFGVGMVVGIAAVPFSAMLIPCREYLKSALLVYGTTACVAIALAAFGFGDFFMGLETLLPAYGTFVVSCICCGIVSLVRTPRSRSCPHCGYDLRGLKTQGCPECGWNRK